ncbi:P-loop containing nucleoside triphosphate hydrolase protein [Radiomyces spectabilis]|uniref:P-loop containing nucleoside triphosphate hydrolase protein n=1 Tax=Radiomyces spectabilis TaxID=64574 RepID=UPI00221F31FC|nr:P-loop containing nucleoside triphosphate hydrolase protein [Radiomyces spectabilis]KAI8393661.1 P-loop containing nucleoside triphosphate hydrolase protein [Radiomyces spectabilis]
MWSFNQSLISNCESSTCESFTTRIFNTFQHVTLPSWLSASVPLPNQVVEQANNIQVFLRYRGLHGDNDVSPATLKANPSSPEKEVLFGNEQERYTFDHVFDQSSSQESIFRQVAEPMIEQIMNGYNCAVIACGQSGSGKSYTMQGNMEEFSKNCPVDAGMVPRTLYRLFENLRLCKYDAAVQISLVELCNNRLCDLLSIHDNHSNLGVQLDPITSAVTIQGCNEPLIRSADEGLSILRYGMKVRTIGATNSHTASNRGHCFLTIKVNIRDIVGDKAIIRSGKLAFVDLAGSELNTEGYLSHVFQSETAYVNKGLLALQDVIQELAGSGSTNLYGSSMLTCLLKDSLGGHTQTCILATASTAEAHYNDTLATLKNATLARQIANYPRTNATTYHDYHAGALEVPNEKPNAEVKYNEETNQVSMSKELFCAWEQEMKKLKESCQQNVDELQKYREQMYQEGQRGNNCAPGFGNQILNVTKKEPEKKAQVAKLTLQIQHQGEMMEHQAVYSREIIAALSSTIQEKEEQIAALNERVTRYEQIIKEHDDKITRITERKDGEIAQLNAQNKEIIFISKRKDEEIARLNETVVKCEQTIEDKNDEIKRMFKVHGQRRAVVIEVVEERDRMIEEDKKEVENLKRTIEFNQRYHDTYVQDLEAEMEAQQILLRIKDEELQKLKAFDSKHEQQENDEAGMMKRIDQVENQVPRCYTTLTTVNETKSPEPAKGILRDASNQATGKRKRKVEFADNLVTEYSLDPLAHDESEIQDVKEEPPDRSFNKENQPRRRLKRQKSFIM